MKINKLLSLAATFTVAFFIACSPVAAQWQVPLGNTPYGRGAGTGFGSVKAYPAGAYGVKCDGNKDDTAAINTAIQTAAVTGGTVELPLGTCKITGAVQLAQGVTLKGQGAAINLNNVFAGLPDGKIPTCLSWAGGASGIMVNTPDYIQDAGLTDICINGNVSSAGIGTSALKGVRLQSGFSNKFERVSITNIGIGVSIESKFTAGSQVFRLTSWNSFVDLRMLMVGDGIAIGANATMPDIAAGSGGITNNFFYRTVIYGCANVCIKLAAMADDNHFDGGHVAGKIGIIYNTLSPTTAVGVYANDFTNFDIEMNDSVGDGYPIIVNNTNGFNSTFKGILALQGPFFNNVQINNGGLLTVIDNGNPAGPRQQLDTNGLSGLSMLNTNIGSAASTSIVLGTAVDAGMVQIKANSATNTSLAGVNSLNLSNSAGPIAFWLSSAQAGRFDSNGFTVGNSGIGNAVRSIGAASGAAVGIAAVGVDANIQFSISAKGSAPVAIQSPLALASTINGNTFTAGSGTLTLAAGKTLTDTSAVGAKVLLGTTGGGFTGLTGNTCTNQVGTAISNAGVLTCSSLTNAYLTAGTFSSITGTGTLTAGTASTGFTVAASNVTWTGTVPRANGGTQTTTGAFVKLNAQVFTASGTYTPSAGLLYAEIECIGGGGGGGGVLGALAYDIGAGGGGSGSYSKTIASAATIGASQTVTIGAAGAGGAAGVNNGIAGGDSSVGALCIGKGGSGGQGISQAASANGGLGGVAGTGTITGTGVPGGAGFFGYSSVTVLPQSGIGASLSPYGGGGLAVTAGSAVAASAGNNASGHGSGGSGAAAAITSTSAAGGNGSAGYVIITEHLNQ